MTAPARPVPALATFAVSVALIAANALAYGFTVLAARLLNPEGYGELAALLGVLLIAVVPASGLQTAGALALARGRSAVTAGQLHGAGLVLAAAVAALAVLATPLVGALLHLPDPGVALWLAVLLVPHTVLGADQGILQGHQRFGRLAAITVVFTVARIAGAVAGLVAIGGVGGALGGMTVGAVVGAVLAWLGCEAPRPGVGSRAVLGGVLRSSLTAALALLGFVLLTGLDVILARHWLAPAAAGEYAVGAIISKVVFWLPQGVGVVVLPRLADPTDRRRAIPTAVAVVGGLGALLTVATAVAGERAVPLIGGSGYGAATGGAAWLFAAVGTLLAVAQLLLYSGIATADRASGVAVWLAVGLEIGVVAGLAGTDRLSVPAIAATATVVAGLLVAAGLLRFVGETNRNGGADEPDDPNPPTTPIAIPPRSPADPNRSDSPRPNPARRNSARPDSARPDSTWPDSTWPDSTWPDSTRPDSTRASDRPDPDHPDSDPTRQTGDGAPAWWPAEEIRARWTSEQARAWWSNAHPSGRWTTDDDQTDHRTNRRIDHHAVHQPADHRPDHRPDDTPDATW